MGSLLTSTPHRRCLGIAKRYGVDATLLVAKNIRKWPALNKTAPLRAGTHLRLPVAGDTLQSIQEATNEEAAAEVPLSGPAIIS